MSKAAGGNYFEDFRIGQEIRHATPRTIAEGDAALYTALYGSRFALQSADAFAQGVGLDQAPIDDLLVFHVVFGKTVPDVSLNAVANLGYAEGRFLAPVYPGDTLTARSTVIGLKENSNKQTGIVYVRTAGENQMGEPVLQYVRWVMVRKRDVNAAPPATRCLSWPRGYHPMTSGCPRGSTSPPRTTCWRARHGASRTMPRARRSIMWTA